MNGEYAHANGMLGLTHRGFEINDYSKHIIHPLKNHGYYSTLLGHQHIIQRDREHEIGYDEIIDRSQCNNSISITDIAPLATDFFNRDHQQPFFLELGCFETHREFPEHNVTNDPRWGRPPEILSGTPQTRIDTVYLTLHGYGIVVRRYSTPSVTIKNNIINKGKPPVLLVVFD